MRTVKGSRVSLSTGHHVAPSDDVRVVLVVPVKQRVERNTPHLALGAGGACVASLLRMDGGPLRRTSSLCGACTTSNWVLRELRSLWPTCACRFHREPRVTRTHGRDRGPGAWAEARASVAVEVEGVSRGHGVRCRFSVVCSVCVMPETQNRAADDRLEGCAFGLSFRCPHGCAKRNDS